MEAEERTAKETWWEDSGIYGGLGKEARERLVTDPVRWLSEQEVIAIGKFQHGIVVKYRGQPGETKHVS